MDAKLARSRIIIDSSFIRGCAADGSRLRRLADNGARLVLIDNLVYELCSTENRAQWPASQRKLMPCTDAVECWEHTGVMLKDEAERVQPCSDPLREETTQAMRQLLRSGSTYTPDNLADMTRQAGERRETESVPALFRACEACASYVPELAAVLRDQKPDDVGSVCYSIINDPEMVRRWMRDGTSPCPFPVDRVDETWLAWHHYKAILAFLCEFLRQGSPRFDGLKCKAKHRWINRKHDLDYLISLSRADGLATDETAGEMYHFCRWLYGKAKAFISPQDV